MTSRSLKLDDKDAMGQQEAHDTGSTWVQRIVVGPSFSQKCARESYAARKNLVLELAQKHGQTLRIGTRHRAPGTWQAGMRKQSRASASVTGNHRITGPPAITGHSRRLAGALGMTRKEPSRQSLGYGGKRARCAVQAQAQAQAQLQSSSNLP